MSPGDLGRCGLNNIAQLMNVPACTLGKYVDVVDRDCYDFDSIMQYDPVM